MSEKMTEKNAVPPNVDEIPDPTVLSEFAKTSTAAKLSGTFHETAGFFKRTLGSMTDDTKLKEAGRNQQILGKVHRVVGNVREVRELVVARLSEKRTDGEKLLRKHGGKLLDLAAEFVDDVKKTFL